MPSMLCLAFNSFMSIPAIIVFPAPGLSASKKRICGLEAFFHTPPQFGAAMGEVSCSLMPVYGNTSSHDGTSNIVNTAECPLLVQTLDLHLPLIFSTLLFFTSPTLIHKAVLKFSVDF